MSMIDDSKLVEYLVRSDVISKKELRRGVDLAKKRGKSLHETLVDADLIDERTLVKALGKLLDVAPVWLGDRTPDADVTDQVPRSLAVRNQVLPLKVEKTGDGRRIVLAMVDPHDILAMDEIATHADATVRPVLAGAGDLRRALERVYGAQIEQDEDLADLDALEQAASGEVELDVDDLEELELDDDDGLADDSWASFFDEAQQVDHTEDSSVISRDMKDRAISSVLDAVDPQESEEEDEDSLKSLDEPLSRSQITGGIEPDLARWEVDAALDGKEDDASNRDYAKIGELFVYSPEKAAEQSEAEDTAKEDSQADDEAKKKAEKKNRTEPSQSEPSQSEPSQSEPSQSEPSQSEPSQSEPNESEPSQSDDEKSAQKSSSDGIGAELSAAIVVPPKRKRSVSDRSSEIVAAADSSQDMEAATQTDAAIMSANSSTASEASEADDEDDDTGHTAFGFGPASLAGDEDSEEDEDDDTGHTAFGFGPGSLQADDSEPSEADEVVEPAQEDAAQDDADQDDVDHDGATEVRSTNKNPAIVLDKVREMNSEASLHAAFVERMAQMAGLDAASQHKLRDASPAELIYATVLALSQSGAIDAHDLLEFLGGSEN